LVEVYGFDGGGFECGRSVLNRRGLSEAREQAGQDSESRETEKKFPPAHDASPAANRMRPEKCRHLIRARFMGECPV